MLNNRYSGILLHISSLNGDCGIGTIGNEAYHFIDFLNYSKTTLWQILPINPTDNDNSPFQCFSAFAGNYLFIDLDNLIELGLLSNKKLLNYKSFFSNSDKVDFFKVSKLKLDLLQNIFTENRNNISNLPNYEKFLFNNDFWLNDFSLFISLKKYFKNISFCNWEDKYKYKTNEIFNNTNPIILEDIEFQKFLQYLFFSQWEKLKKYANEKNVKIVGDMPIYVSYNSADVWANSHNFLLYNDLTMQKIAGVPPDYFSETGQLWGNPVYNWHNIKNNNFEWWQNRFNFSNKLYDYIRIDHFRAFCEFWAVEPNQPNAINGEWIKANGEELFELLKNKYDLSNIIAEDLGIIDENVEKLRDKYNLKGMKILQFAFNSCENNKYLPHNYDKNCVVYTGTHDNNTTLGWIKTANELEKVNVINYTNSNNDDIVSSLIRVAFSSVADFAIIPMQDFLELDDSCRMNIPGTIQNNWNWKLTENQLNNRLAEQIKTLNEVYFRKLD